MRVQISVVLALTAIPFALLSTPYPANGQAGSVSFAASAVQVTEGALNAMITVERRDGSAGAISVDYATGGGNATPGLDYAAITGTLSWPAGDSSDRNILVTILDDNQDEQPETFKVTLSDPTGGATLGIPSTTTVTIFDDDEPGLCTSGPTTLCLNEGRFKVEASWMTSKGGGASGMGVAQTLTVDTGYFWFFDPANVELIIKVLDACYPPFNHFWVFAAGLTNVEVELTVTDTETNEVKVYRNPLGQAFEPIQDTAAFATCP